MSQDEFLLIITGVELRAFGNRKNCKNPKSADMGRSKPTILLPVDFPTPIFSIL
jgi:hypothetical protein